MCWINIYLINSRSGRYLNDNKLSGAIPGDWTTLTKMTSNLRLHNNNGQLCRLDADSTSVAGECTATACPYPTCSCKYAECPNGAENSGTLAVNLATPFYPAENTACCPSGNTLRERLVTATHLDCTVGRPCNVATGSPGIGTLATKIT